VIRTDNVVLKVLTMAYKNSSGDEIANVNFLTTMSHSYFKIPKKRTYFV